MALNYNTDFLPNVTHTGASNTPRYLHINQSTPTSAQLLNASVEHSIFHCCTVIPNPFSREYPFREYPSGDTEQIVPSPLLPSQTTFSRQPSCPKTTDEAHYLLQHGAMGRCRCTTQGSPLSFPTLPINHIRGPSASIRLSHGNNGTALDNPMYAMNDYTFPNFTYNGQDQHAFSGTNRVINDVQQPHMFPLLHMIDDVQTYISDIDTSISRKKHSTVGEMNFGYGISDANIEFNRQHSRSLNSPSHPMPVRNKSKSVRAAYNHDTAQALTQIQSSTSKANDSTSTEVKRHSAYSPSVFADGTRWHCNQCEYTAEREQDMIRHCSTLSHGGRRFFSCPSCGKRFSRKDSVTRHSKNTSCGLRLAPLSGRSA